MPDKRILIVEDDAIVAMTIEDSLHELGYSVVGQASDSENAKRLAGEKRPDLILMDIRIQGKKDGIETAAEINESYNIPIIYLTAYSDNETIRRAAKTQPYGFLTKPFNLKEMYSTIEIAIYKHRVMNREAQVEAGDQGGGMSRAGVSSESFERTLLDHIGIPVFVLSRDMKLAYYNKPLEEFFRRTGCLDVRLDRSIFEIAPPSLIGLAKEYRMVFETNRMSRIEKEIINEGKRGRFGIIVVPLSDGTTTPGYVLGIIKDISREQAAEDWIEAMYENYEQILTKIGGIMQITRGKEDKDMKDISARISDVVIAITKMDPRRWRFQ